APDLDPGRVPQTGRQFLAGRVPSHRVRGSQAGTSVPLADLPAGGRVEDAHFFLLPASTHGQQLAVGAPDQWKGVMLRYFQLAVADLEKSYDLLGGHIPDPQAAITDAETGEPLAVGTPEQGGGCETTLTGQGSNRSGMPRQTVGDPARGHVP